MQQQQHLPFQQQQEHLQQQQQQYPIQQQQIQCELVLPQLKSLRDLPHLVFLFEGHQGRGPPAYNQVGPTWNDKEMGGPGWRNKQAGGKQRWCDLKNAYVHVKKLATACPPMTHMEAAAAMDTFRGWTGPQGAKPRWQLATFIRDSHLLQQAVEELSAGWGGAHVGAGRGAQVMCPGIPYYPPLMMPPSEVFMLDNGGMVSSGSLDC